MKVLVLSVVLALCCFAVSVKAACSTAEKDAIALCAINQYKAWNVQSVDMNVPSKKLCCAIWNSLDCQVKIAKLCDSSYSEKLTKDTEKAYRTQCVLYPRKSPKCVLGSS